MKVVYDCIFPCLFLSGKLRVFINYLLLEIFGYNEAFTINAVLLHDIFIFLILGASMSACVCAWRVSGFQDFDLHTELLFLTGSQFFRSYDFSVNPLLFSGNLIYSTDTETFFFFLNQRPV